MFENFVEYMPDMNSDLDWIFININTQYGCITNVLYVRIYKKWFAKVLQMKLKIRTFNEYTCIGMSFLLNNNWTNHF